MLVDKVKWRLYGAYFSIEDLETLLGASQEATYYEWLLYEDLMEIRMYMAELIL